MLSRLLITVVLLAYVGYGLRTFGLELYTSPRYVRRPPRSGFWGPVRFLSRETWTEEGLRLRNRMLLWQAGCVALIVLVVALW